MTSSEFVGDHCGAVPVMQLQGIFCVINSSRGHHLVFRYPVDLRHSPLDSDVNVTEYSYNNSTAEIDKSTKKEDAPAHKSNEYANLNVSFIGDAFSPKASACGKRFQISFDWWTFLGHPVLLNGEEDVENSKLEGKALTTEGADTTGPTQPSDHAEIQATETKTSPSMEISMFHIVFAFPRARTVDDGRFLDDFYENVVKKLSLALKSEQVASDYVRNECEMILKLAKLHKDAEEFTLKALEQSAFAKMLKRIYADLSCCKTSLVKLNGKILISLNPVASSRNFGLDDIKPFHTLLLSAPKEELIAELKDLGGSNLIEFLNSTSIRKSLDEIRKRLAWNWDKVEKYAARLLRWNNARLILPLNSDSIYGYISPSIDVKKESTLFSEWKKKFPSIDLFALLSTISSEFQPLLSFVPSEEDRLKLNYLEALEYLFRRNILHQVHTTYFLVYPDKNDPNSSVIDPMTDPSLKFVEEAAMEQNDQVNSKSLIFLRILRYFDGNYTMEEILYMERVSKRDFHAAIEQFGKYILTFHAF